MKIGRRDFLKGLGAVIAGLLLPMPKRAEAEVVPGRDEGEAQLVGVHPVASLSASAAGRYILSYVFLRPDMGSEWHTAAAEYDRNGGLLRQWLDGKEIPLDKRLPLSLECAKSLPKRVSNIWLEQRPPAFASGTWRMAV